MVFDAIARHPTRMPAAVCLMVKPVGKPDAVAPHVRFDERGWETGLYATAPILDSTGQPESLFGADYLRKNHLSQKFAELRYIEIIAGWLRSQIP